MTLLLIASRSQDKTIKIWNITTGININSFNCSSATEVISFIDYNLILIISLGRFSVKSQDNNITQQSKRKANLDSHKAQAETDGQLGFRINNNKI
ncbi:unnamed protein product [Fusarium graminearum]|nr:unnamed protein product [Fusarium graminearum]